jgi:hypothetical protein
MEEYNRQFWVSAWASSRVPEKRWPLRHWPTQNTWPRRNLPLSPLVSLLRPRGCCGLMPVLRTAKPGHCPSDLKSLFLWWQDLLI